jgi:hypothetical protein
MMPGSPQNENNYIDLNTKVTSKEKLHGVKIMKIRAMENLSPWQL